MKKVKLGDVCTKASSSIKQKDLDGQDGQYAIYGASGFIKNVNFYQQDKEYLAVVKDGAGIGRVMKLPPKTSIIGTLQYVLPKADVDIGYLFYAMDHMNLSKYYTGATIPHIYFRDYQNEMLLFHPLEEQQCIASVLDKVSDLIDKRRQQMAKLDLLVKSQFIEMFGDPLFDFTTGNSIPVRDACIAIRGGGTPSKSHPEYYTGNIPWVTPKDMKTETIMDTRRYLTEDWKSNIRGIRDKMMSTGEYKEYKNFIRNNSWVEFRKYINKKNILAVVITVLLFVLLWTAAHYADKQLVEKVWEDRFWNIGCSGLVGTGLIGLFRFLKDKK